MAVKMLKVKSLLSSISVVALEVSICSVNTNAAEIVCESGSVSFDGNHFESVQDLAKYLRSEYDKCSLKDLNDNDELFLKRKEELGRALNQIKNIKWDKLKAIGAMESLCEKGVLDKLVSFKSSKIFHYVLNVSDPSDQASARIWPVRGISNNYSSSKKLCDIEISDDKLTLITNLGDQEVKETFCFLEKDSEKKISDVLARLENLKRVYFGQSDKELVAEDRKYASVGSMLTDFFRTLTDTESSFEDKIRKVSVYVIANALLNGGKNTTYDSQPAQ